MIDILIEHCKIKIESEVKRFYELGPKQYVLACGGYPNIKKSGWLSQDYKMVYDAYVFNGVRYRKVIVASVGMGSAEFYIHRQSCIYEDVWSDEHDYHFFFPSEFFLNSFVESVNLMLQNSEIVVKAQRRGQHPYRFNFTANLGQL